jgi:hypothetical protein
MQFEPVILAGFEPRVQIGLNPFEPSKSNEKYFPYVRTLTGNLTVIRSITTRTGEPVFAFAVTLVIATARFLSSLTQMLRADMNPRSRSKKSHRIPRTSKYMHLWPELEFMPPLDHWPHRPELYRPENSQVLGYIGESFGMSLDDAEKVFDCARKRRSLRYDDKTGLWVGRKGGQL